MIYTLIKTILLQIMLQDLMLRIIYILVMEHTTLVINNMSPTQPALQILGLWAIFMSMQITVL